MLLVHTKNFYMYTKWVSEVTQSCLTLCDPMDCSHQVPLPMGFPRQEHWSGLPFPFPGDLPAPENEPVSPALAGRFFTNEPPVAQGGPWLRVIRLLVLVSTLQLPCNRFPMVRHLCHWTSASSSSTRGICTRWSFIHSFFSPETNIFVYICARIMLDTEVFKMNKTWWKFLPL